MIATAHPRAPIPLLVLASAAPLAALIGVALAHRALAFATFLALAALVPWTGRERLRRAGVLLAYAGAAYSLYAIVRVPLGALAGALHLPAVVAFAARAAALGGEAARRWAHPRWAEGVSAEVRPVGDAVTAALRASPADTRTIDAAIVALAAAPPSVIPDDPTARRAFWLNAYNALARHANRGRWSARALAALEVVRTRYRVAGVPLTLDEIEHGLLRDGAPPPAAPWARMPPGDPRRRWAVPLDPRIHFALHCGAASCPPIRVYHADTLDTDLETATQSFLAVETNLDAAAGVIETSRLLSWYARDFGGPRGVYALLARALDKDPPDLAPMRLRYKRYDWTSV